MRARMSRHPTPRLRLLLRKQLGNVVLYLVHGAAPKKTEPRACSLVAPAVGAACGVCVVLCPAAGLASECVASASSWLHLRLHAFVFLFRPRDGVFTRLLLRRLLSAAPCGRSLLASRFQSRELRLGLCPHFDLRIQCVLSFFRRGPSRSRSLSVLANLSFASMMPIRDTDFCFERCHFRRQLEPRHRLRIAQRLCSERASRLRIRRRHQPSCR